MEHQSFTKRRMAADENPWRTSDNLHQTDGQTEDGSIQADESVYSGIASHIICLNRIPTPGGNSAEKSLRIQGENCCMDWTMMFNAVIHEHKNIDEIIMGRGTEQPFLNPGILEETARRVALINEDFIGQECGEFLGYLQTLKNIEMERQQGHLGSHVQMLADRGNGRSGRWRGGIC